MQHLARAAAQVHKDRRDWHNLRGMLPFLWEFRGRALFALSCLVLSKVANVGVPLVLKEIVEHYERAREEPMLLAAALPVSLLLAYGLLKLSSTLFNELRDVVFAKVNTEEQQEIAAHFQIRSIPTLMIFRDKIIIFSEAGALPESAFRELVGKAGELDMDEVRRQVAEQQQSSQA